MATKLDGAICMGDNITLIRDRADINAFFREQRNCLVQVWRYHVSHSWLELLVTHRRQVPSTDEYTTINCHMTHSMQLPTLVWKSDLRVIVASHAEIGNVECLEDSTVDVRIVCDHLSLAIGHHPKF